MLSSTLPPLSALLIFNPFAGPPGAAAGQLLSILAAMQEWNIRAEVHLVNPGGGFEPVVQDALTRGVPLIVAAGGDSTVASVARLVEAGAAGCPTPPILGILPSGTKNNIALSLGIPLEIPAAVAALRGGHLGHIDLGLVRCGGVERRFVEICSVGLLSALFPAADDVQKGNLARLGDLLSTLVISPPADLRLTIDETREVRLPGHIVLVGNMPYTGPNYQIAPENAFDDGFLDVLVFSSLSKLDLLGAALQGAGGAADDPRILRYSARSVTIETEPPMPVLADGFAVGQSPLSIHMLPGSLPVMLPGPELGEHRD